MTFSKTRMAATGSGMEDRLLVLDEEDGASLSAEGGSPEEMDGDFLLLDRWRHRSAITGCCFSCRSSCSSSW